MLPIARKSVEPIAAHIEPIHVRARHQSLHHFVAKPAWSDSAVSAPVCNQVEPLLVTDTGHYWIIDDTGFPKKGKHSVGVARQYCSQLGKQDNCQAGVSLSLATELGSMPIAYQLYLPKDWASDPDRALWLACRKRSRLPPSQKSRLSSCAARSNRARHRAWSWPTQGMATTPAFAMALPNWAFCMRWASGRRPRLWAPGAAPLPPKAWSGRGIRPTRLRGKVGNAPVSVKALALSLPSEAYRSVTWREGSNTNLSSRFASVLVHPAHRDYLGTEMRAEEWLLI